MASPLVPFIGSIHNNIYNTYIYIMYIHGHPPLQDLPISFFTGIQKKCQICMCTSIHTIRLSNQIWIPKLLWDPWLVRRWNDGFFPLNLWGWSDAVEFEVHPASRTGGPDPRDFFPSAPGTPQKSNIDTKKMAMFKGSYLFQAIAATIRTQTWHPIPAPLAGLESQFSKPSFWVSSR